MQYIYIYIFQGPFFKKSEFYKTLFKKCEHGKYSIQTLFNYEYKKRESVACIAVKCAEI